MSKKTGLNFFGVRSGVIQRLADASLKYVSDCCQKGMLEGRDEQVVFLACAAVIFHRGTKKEKEMFLDLVILMDLKECSETSSLFFIAKLVELLSDKQLDDIMSHINIGPDGLVFNMDEDDLMSLFHPLFSVYDDDFVSRYGEQLDSLRKEYNQLLMEAKEDESTGNSKLYMDLVESLKQQAHKTLGEMLKAETAEKKIGAAAPK